MSPPFLQMRRSFFAKYVIAQAVPSACCREVPACAGKAVSWERVNHGREQRLSSASLLFPSFLCSLPLSLLSLDHRVREAGVGHRVWLLPLQNFFLVLGVRAPRGEAPRLARGRPATQRARCRSPGDETSRLSRGLTSFLSLCLLKLLPVASGFPEGSS